MTLNLLKRGEKGSALNATEHDANLTAIEDEVNAKSDAADLGTASELDVPVSGNAAPGEVVTGSDTRLTDAREWTATTVTQAEAEAGTNTDRKAWSVLRVWQAMAAWLLTVSTAPGRALMTGTNAAAQRTSLELGTAATHDVPTGSNDATSGQVVKGHDTRLTDSREWIAPTVSQAEVETGGDTARKAFTVLRVWQAVAAWWAASSAKTKLDGIATGATANSPDAALRDRNTHTGTQAAGTITGLAAVATTGAYADLTGTPTLGTAAATDATAYATAAQGTKADSAMQASDVGTIATQVEVEAGTGTAVQRLSVLRVWQAMAAWLQTVSTAAGRALMTAADAAAQRVAMEAARSGAVTGSGLTMATARLVGRSTAGTGAPEEITVGSGLTLSAGTLTASGGGGSPGGSDTQVQFNDGGAFAGASGWTWNKATNTMTLGGGTQTTSNPTQVVTQTWNNAGVTFNAWSLDVIDTASGANSTFQVMRVGGAIRYQLTKSGVGMFSAGFLLGGTSSYGGDAVWGSGNAINISSTAVLSFGNSDLVVRRDAANTFAQRNATNAQEHRVYGTFTDASNHRRLSKGMSTAGVAFIRPEGAGTGASGNVLHISGLPTSNPGPGILWNDAGTVKVGT